jgi:aspartate aminotransferase/aminotransferase
VDAGNVIVTTGAVGGIYSVVTALVDPGDEVLLPDPVWPNYRSIVHVAGGRIVSFPLHPESGFLPDPQEVAARITPRTKLMVINTPCNPTGTILPGEILSALGEIASQTGVWIVSDEIYEDLVFENKHVSLLGRAPADRTVIISGFSKTYAMTGWRLGWVVCSPALASVLTALQEPLTSGASAIAQKAGEAALTGPQDCVEAFREAFRRRRDLVLEIVGDLLAARPAGSFYALVNVQRKTPNSLEFAKDLLSAQGVAVVPAGAFGSITEGHVRVAFTLPEPELREGLTRLRKYVMGGSE